jgi:glycine C-acetyltransferase
VFPMTGQVAKIAEIYALAAKYRAMVVVDDSEGIGVLGDRGEGAHGLDPLPDGIDVATGSFGAALGGGAGGFVAGRKTVVSWLRQKSRSHAASAALAPGAVAAARKAIELVGIEPDLRATLLANLRTFKEAMARDAGLLVDITHPATTVLVRNAVLAQRLTDFLYRRGIFAIGYCHPVVPEGEARLCLRVTARHRAEDLEKAAKAIGEGMKELKIPL